MGSATLTHSRDDAVSLVRLTGMTCILLCHLSTWFGLYALTQLFNVGVPLFLMVSGYLYAGKDLRPVSFLCRRYVKVTVPVLLFLAFLSAFYLISVQTPAWETLPLYLVNLQGVSFLCGYIPYTEFCTGVGHLWFLTVLFVCYLCILPLGKLRASEKLSVRGAVCLVLASTAAVAALIPVRIYLQYIQIFLIGYFGKKFFFRIRTKTYLLFTCLMVCAIALRLVMRRTAGETVAYTVAAALSHNVLAFWIFSTFKWFAGRNETLVRDVSQHPVVRHMDELSYPVYIVHYMFLVGPFKVDALGLGKGIGLIVFLGATFLCAEILLALVRLPARISRKKHRTA